MQPVGARLGAVVAGLSLLAAAGCQTSTVGAARVPSRFAGDPVPPRALEPARFPAPSRAVAAIVSPRWSGEDARDAAGEAERVMDALGVGPGLRVADIGAGDGYYTLRLAPRVDSTGRVYAEDITPAYLSLLRDRVAAAGLTNVAVIAGAPHDPRLPAGTIDLALFIHMYHEIEQPFALLHTLARSMAPGGRVAVYEPEAPTARHGTPQALLRCELEAVGYRQREVRPMGGRDYLAVFDAPPADSLPGPRTIASRLRAANCAELAA